VAPRQQPVERRTERGRADRYAHLVVPDSLLPRALEPDVAEVGVGVEATQVLCQHERSGGTIRYGFNQPYAIQTPRFTPECTPAGPQMTQGLRVRGFLIHVVLSAGFEGGSLGAGSATSSAQQ